MHFSLFVGLKTYLISGRKMGSQCGCFQLSLGRDYGEILSPSSNTHTPDLTYSALTEPLSHSKVRPSTRTEMLF